MSLLEHLKELRVRLVRALLGIAAGCVVGWVFYDPIFKVIRTPFDQVIADAENNGQNIVLALSGVGEAFTLQVQVVAVSGLMFSLPIWLYQLWRFLAPGLRSHERRWGYGFIFAATPMFVVGTLIAYVAMKPLLELLLGFTPQNVSNIINVSTYLSFILQLMLFFGLGALIPLVFVMLNLAGALTGAALLRAWRWLLVGCLTFAAVATPSPDPINMLLVAMPFAGLVALAVSIMLANDARRVRRDARAATGASGASSLEPAPRDSTNDPDRASGARDRPSP